MDSIFIQRMRENRKWYLIMSIVYGERLRSVCTGIYQALHFRDNGGFTLVFRTFPQKSRNNFQKGTMGYFAGILLLGISTVLTDSGFFHFFNSVGIILLFMMAMAHQLYKDSDWGFTEYVKKFFIMLWTWLISVGELFRGRERNAEVKTDAAVTDDNVDTAGENTVSGKRNGKMPVHTARNTGSGAYAYYCTASAHDVR